MTFRYSNVGFESTSEIKLAYPELLQNQVGKRDIFFYFPLKLRSWNCLLGSILKLILKCHLFIWSKFWCKVSLPSTIKNKGRSSANILVVEDSLSVKLSIQTKNHYGPLRETLRQYQPIKNILSVKICFLFFKTYY